MVRLQIVPESLGDHEPPGGLIDAGKLVLQSVYDMTSPQVPTGGSAQKYEYSIQLHVGVTVGVGVGVGHGLCALKHCSHDTSFK